MEEIAKLPVSVEWSESVTSMLLTIQHTMVITNIYADVLVDVLSILR